MAGFIPAIHVFLTPTAVKTWMAGTSPAMTKNRKKKNGGLAARRF
jgi:hypothetical protein